MFICNLHCQLFYVFPVICYIKTRPDAKFSIVPEEGWFGQPKYSTRSKKHSTLCRFLPLYSSKKMTNCRRVIVQRVVSLFFPVKFQQTILGFHVTSSFSKIKNYQSF